MLIIKTAILVVESLDTSQYYLFLTKCYLLRHLNHHHHHRHHHNHHHHHYCHHHFHHHLPHLQHHQVLQHHDLNHHHCPHHHLQLVQRHLYQHIHHCLKFLNTDPERDFINDESAMDINNYSQQN